MPSYDAIVVGTGGIGSAALDHLARRKLRVLGLDRFPPAHDRGSSHGQSRMIRQAYFEHPDYVPMVLRAYEGWADLSRRRGRALYHETGLLEIGPVDGVVVPGVLKSAREHRLEVDQLSPAELASRFPGFHVPPHFTGVFERRAGYLEVEQCVRAYLDEATAAGAELRSDETVLGWRAVGSGVEVETSRGRYSAGRLIITAGAWASDLLADLGLRLSVVRKPLYWYRPRTSEYDVERGGPAFLYETAEGIFYGFPRIDEAGVKVAEHTGGVEVADPLTIDRAIDPIDQRRVEAFLAEQMPGVSRELGRHAVCMYTLTPDRDFIVDRHPAAPQVSFVAGLSGHGFKFVPVLGEALADLATDTTSAVDLSFLRHDRAGLRA
jgi:sarcosine oxidase